MNPARSILITIKKRRPHPLFEVQLLREGGASFSLPTPHRFAEFVLLKDEILQEVAANPALWMPEFPRRFLRSRLGVGLSSRELNKRAAGLDAWMKCLVSIIDDMSARAQAVLKAFLNGKLVSMLAADRVAAAQRADSNEGGGRDSGPTPPACPQEQELEKEDGGWGAGKDGVVDTPPHAGSAFTANQAARFASLQRRLGAAEALMTANPALVSLSPRQRERLGNLARRLARVEDALEAWTSEDGPVFLDRDSDEGPASSPPSPSPPAPPPGASAVASPPVAGLMTAAEQAARFASLKKRMLARSN